MGGPRPYGDWPWSDLLTDVVLTSAGGLGVKGRGEGVVWAAEPLWASDSVKRKGVPEFLKVNLLRCLTFCSALRSPSIPESAFFEISDVLFCAQESQNSRKSIF